MTLAERRVLTELGIRFFLKFGLADFSSSVNAAFSEHSKNALESMPRHLACAETWASNQRAASLVELPGLTAWVHSVPVSPSHAAKCLFQLVIAWQVALPTM